MEVSEQDLHEREREREENRAFELEELLSSDVIKGCGDGGSAF